MRKIRRTFCALLSLFLVLGLSACSGGGYRVIDTYSTEGDYVISFRQGDRLCDIVTAALQELAHNGTLSSVSLKWFGEDIVSLKAKGGEMAEFQEEVAAASRTVTVGVDITNMPMSYETAEGFLGFDVDLANYICSYLGWNMAVHAIDPEDVAIELDSGNIDMAMGIAQDGSKLSMSPAYISSSYVLVARVSGPVRSRAALKGKTLGVVITDIDVLQRDEKFMKSLGSVTYQTNTDGLFQALLKDEVDGILVPSVVAAYYMK